MKTKRYSKLSSQNKKKQKKTKKTKTRGGVHIIGNEPSPSTPPDPNLYEIIDSDDYDDDDADPLFPPEIQNIVDNSITFRINQKNDIISFNEHLLTIRSMYFDLHPHWGPTTSDFYSAQFNQGVPYLIWVIIENIKKLRVLFRQIIHRNHLNAARIIYEYLVADVRPRVLKCIEDNTYYQTVWHRFYTTINSQLPYAQQIDYELNLIRDYQEKYADKVTNFFMYYCYDIGVFCNLYDRNIHDLPDVIHIFY